MLKRLAFLTAFVVALLAMGGTASAGTIKVTTTLDELDGLANATCSLREAISTANTDANVGGCTDGNNATTADTVALSGEDYGLTRTGVSEDNNSAGDLDVTEALTISGVGADLTGINGNGDITTDRVLHLTAGTLKLTKVRIYGGATTTNVVGGGIASEPAGSKALTLVDSAVSGNSALSGGGISAAGVTLTRSSVSGNHADGGGGGGIVGNLVTLTDSTVSHNSVTGSGTGVAGGIAAQKATLTRTVVSDNSAVGSGGGLFGAGTITDSRIVRNHASQGGGIFDEFGPLTISRSTISGNKATQSGGGGLGLASAGPYTIKNATVSGNTTVSAGGGIVVEEGAANLNNVTIARNTADANSSGGEGGGGVAQSGTGVLRLRNSLVAENAALGGGAPECLGTLTNPSHTAFTTGGGCTVSGTSEGVILGGSPIGGLQDNGGLTPTRALLPGNLAINAGYPGTGTGVPCEATDQRGLPRGGAAGRCDIGAFEVQP